MSGKCQHIFVDESGGTDLPDVPASEHDYYVISGVLVPGEQLTQAQRAAESIVERHAGDGELKSSRIGGKLDRRERILSDIARHQFTFYCLVVNKNLIWRDSGLRWKPSFYKFLHRMFYSRIKGAYLELQIVADEYGRSEFMTSFATYIQQMGSLFETFRFERSESAPLLQIADIVAGSMRRAFSGDDPPDTLKKFTDIKILIEEWPPKEAWGETSPESSAFDEAIRGIALRAARDYVEKNLGSDDEDAQLRAQAFRYLLYRYDNDPEDFVTRAEVVSHLGEVMDQDLTEQVLTTKVFADARDCGVIIASTDAGIKIPYNAKDLSEWMARVEGQVAPYLRRVEEARKIILLASHQQHDIAAAQHFPALCKYLNAK